METKYRVELLPGGGDPVDTPDDFFKLPFVMLSVAKRMSGKTCSMSQFLHILHRMKRLDRVILVSPTYENNKHYFKGLPLNEEEDVLEPSLESAAIIMDRVEEEARVYSEYHEQMKVWNELQRLCREYKQAKKQGLAEDLMKGLQQPTHKYGGRKPVVVAFFDDCQNTAAFSTRSKLSYMTIKHRHIGKTAEGSIGCSLMYACQNYTSASGGIPKTIRGNTTILCVFKNKNMKELDIIAEECSGEVDVDTFMAVHTAATEGDYTFLTIDLNRKSTHPSMFRKCWNQWIMAVEVPKDRAGAGGEEKEQAKPDEQTTAPEQNPLKQSSATSPSTTSSSAPPKRTNNRQKKGGDGVYRVKDTSGSARKKRRFGIKHPAAQPPKGPTRVHKVTTPWRPKPPRPAKGTFI